MKQKTITRGEKGEGGEEIVNKSNMISTKRKQIIFSWINSFKIVPSTFLSSIKYLSLSKKVNTAKGILEINIPFF